MITRRSRRHAASSYSLGTLMERERVLSLFDCSIDLYSDDFRAAPALNVTKQYGEMCRTPPRMKIGGAK